MANYLLTNKAVEDLSDIWFYTLHTWSEKQADKYYELLISTFQQIAEEPDIGKEYPNISHEILGLSAGKHIIFYHKLNSTSIEIIRILHEQMNYKNRLKE